MIKILSIAAGFFFLYRLIFSKPRSLDDSSNKTHNNRHENTEVIDIDYEEVE